MHSFNSFRFHAIFMKKFVKVACTDNFFVVPLAIQEPYQPWKNIAPTVVFKSKRNFSKIGKAIIIGISIKLSVGSV